MMLCGQVYKLIVWANFLAPFLNKNSKLDLESKPIISTMLFVYYELPSHNETKSSKKLEKCYNQNCEIVMLTMSSKTKQFMLQLLCYRITA